jgi:hypothetical protein
MAISRHQPFSLHAVGDISFYGTLCDQADFRSFSAIHTILKTADLVVGNLENPLILQGKSIPGKCTLRGSPGWAAILKYVGIGLVSLANNHIMDYGPEGLFSTIESLKKAGVSYIGAGMNQQEANAPKFMVLKGIKTAFLARSSVIVRSPYYAHNDTPGAAFFDLHETKEAIKQCRGITDLIIICMHWGIEEYSYPSPEQLNIAKELVEAGADIIIGHHPHVVQGVQRVGKSIVAYSLGNFLFDDFLWEDSLNEMRRFSMVLSEENRKGLILMISYGQNGNLILSKCFTSIRSDGSIELDPSPYREEELNIFSQKLDSRFYSQWWRGYALKREWAMRISRKFYIKKILNKLWNIQPGDFKDLIASLKNSSKIILGKTTNPYE